MKLSGNKILITGGATGIGYGLAEKFIKDGNTVIVSSRSNEALDSAAGNLSGLITKQSDLSSETGRNELIEWIKTEHSDTNVLINNAGIQQWMSIDDENFPQRAMDEISINIEAPVHISYLFAKLPSAKVIMNVTSGLSFSPLAKVPVYCATKAFLHSYTRSLRHMLKPKGIVVIEIIPPALNTDLGGKGIHDFAPPVSGFIDSVFTQLSEGKTDITYQYSENMYNIGREELNDAFARMNPD